MERVPAKVHLVTSLVWTILQAPTTSSESTSKSLSAHRLSNETFELAECGHGARALVSIPQLEDFGSLVLNVHSRPSQLSAKPQFARYPKSW